MSVPIASQPLINPPAWESVIVFEVDSVRIGIRLAAVERIARAVEIAPLMDAPAGVLGVINVQGKILPVYDLRPRFGLAPREVRLSDHLVMARTVRRRVALLVDAAVDVFPCEESALTSAGEILPGLDAMHGVLKLGEDIVILHDLERFLSPQDDFILDTALNP